jgi:hypothetical protein
MRKKYLGRVNIKKAVGSYKKLERVLDKQGLLDGIIETTSKGFGGGIWSIRKDGKEYVAISTYSRKVKRRKDGRVFYVYRYYLVEARNFDRLLQILENMNDNVFD